MIELEYHDENIFKLHMITRLTRLMMTRLPKNHFGARRARAGPQRKTQTRPQGPMSDEEDESVPQRRGGDEDDDSVLLPVFINKLIKMLADPECADILQYGTEGNTILVVDSTQFATVRL